MPNRPTDSRRSAHLDGRGFSDRVRDLAREEFDWLLATEGAVGERLLAGSVPSEAVQPPAVVSVFPASPYVGQMIRFRHTAGQPPWLCVWDSALNGGVGAWAVFGGAPLRTEDPTPLSTSSTSYQNFFATVAVPCAGVYDVEFGGLYHTSNDANYVRVSIDGPGSAATDSDVLIRGGMSTAWSTVSKVSRRTFTGVGSVRQYVRSNNVSYSVTATTRYISVTPIELRP